MSWHGIRQKLQRCSERDLIGLIGDLYKLNKENQRFLYARFTATENEIDLSPFKKIIANYVCPEPPHSLRLSVARKAVSDFKKATGHIEDTVELMVYYVEKGVEFTRMYGDINEAFYSSLESMFSSVVKELKRNKALESIFLHRLKKIVHDTRHMGWGFHDYLCEVFYEAFPETVATDGR